MVFQTPRLKSGTVAGIKTRAETYSLRSLPRLPAVFAEGGVWGGERKRAWMHKTWTRNFSIKSPRAQHTLKNKESISLFGSVCFTHVGYQRRKQMGHTAGTERPVDARQKKKTKKKTEEAAVLTNYAYAPLLFLCMQKFVPEGSDSGCWCVEKLCLVLFDVCYRAAATMDVPSVYVRGIIFTPQRLLPFVSLALCKAN